MTYSEILRKLKKDKSKKIEDFRKDFKKAFDEAYCLEVEDLEATALFAVLQEAKDDEET